MHPQPLRHHYIPQFILRNFCFENKRLHYYDKQTGCISVKDTRDIFMVRNLYRDEINCILNDFVETMLDDEHFYICCYDKIFYLATLINSYFFPRQLMFDDPLFYFTQASALTHEDIAIFLKFCECNAIGTDEASMDFCKYVANFDFQKIDTGFNGYSAMAKLVLQEGTSLDFPLPFGCYINPSYTNIINLTALGETILAIKHTFGIQAKDMAIVHDHIKEFEKEFLDTFQTTNVQLDFCDSKDDPLLQYADNVASIFRNCRTYRFHKSSIMTLFLRNQAGTERLRLA